MTFINRRNQHRWKLFNAQKVVRRLKKKRKTKKKLFITNTTYRFYQMLRSSHVKFMNTVFYSLT